MESTQSLSVDLAPTVTHTFNFCLTGIHMQNTQPSHYTVEKTYSNSDRKGAHQMRYELRRGDSMGLFIAVVAGLEPVEQILVYTDEQSCQADWTSIVSGQTVQIDDLNWSECIDLPLTQ